MDRLLRLIGIVRSSLPRPKFRLASMLVLIALMSAFLAHFTNEWRREEREARARYLHSLAEGRKRRADEYRERQRHYLDEVEPLRKRLVRAPSRRADYPPGRWNVPSRENIQAEIDGRLKQAAWAGQIAELLDWAADHPAEPLRPEPPKPVTGGYW